MVKLIYQGGGSIPGVPCKNLDEVEVKMYGGVKLLLSTGLWRIEKTSAVKLGTARMDAESKLEKSTASENKSFVVKKDDEEK